MYTLQAKHFEGQREFTAMSGRKYHLVQIFNTDEYKSMDIKPVFEEEYDKYEVHPEDRRYDNPSLLTVRIKK